jgi:hypothetical protein
MQRFLDAIAAVFVDCPTLRQCVVAAVPEVGKREKDRAGAAEG